MVGAILTEFSFMDEMIREQHYRADSKFSQEELLKIDSISRQAKIIGRACYDADRSVAGAKQLLLRSALSYNPDIRDNYTLGTADEEKIVKEIKETENTIKTLELWEGRNGNRSLSHEDIERLNDSVESVYKNTFNEMSRVFYQRLTMGTYEAGQELGRLGAGLSSPWGFTDYCVGFMGRVMKSKFFSEVDTEWAEAYGLATNVAFHNDDIF